MIKILHLITGLNSGGAEMMLYKILLHMDKTKYQNIVVSMIDKGVLGEQIEKLGIKVYTLDMKRGIPSISSVLLLYKIIKKESPDILQTWLYHADLLGLIIGKIAKVPLIAWNLRCSNMDMNKYSLIVAAILKILARLSKIPDSVVVNSSAGLAFHQGIGYTPKDWKLIYNGFDLDKYSIASQDIRERFRRELGLPEKTFLVGLIARFDPMKDHMNFLKSIKHLVNNYKFNKSICFILAGKGIDWNNTELTRTINEMDIKKYICLLGERKDVPYISSALDIAVSASAYGEGFPNVVGEAMSCGVPCIVTDVGDSAAIARDTGIIVPPKDSQALASALYKFIIMDHMNRQDLGFKARKHIEDNFSILKIARQYEIFYQSLYESK